jgi:hypothetical protein
MIFNIDDHPGDKVVMHCKTKEEAESFCQYLHENGKTWCNGDSYIGRTYWDSNGEMMAYRFNRSTYASVPYYRSEGCTILEWSDYMGHTVLNDTRYSKITK